MSTLQVKLKNKNYNIYIEKDIFNSMGKYIKRIYTGQKIAVVTDGNVDKLYSNVLINSLTAEGFVVSKVVIEPGERSKNINTLTDIYKKFCDSKIRRSDLIIALGGGVVGDITGFASSTYLRGVKYVQIPTTLLAQIDSSVGGKVAVDLPWGKNLIGNFYHPEAVFIDPNVLTSLSDKFFNDGMGEVIKYGFIKSSNFIDELIKYKNKNELLENIEDIIYRCCSIKKELVQKDEFDTGDRMLLNFGHTVGHAIEKVFNYNKYTHGECVAFGMAHITRKSEEFGYTMEGTSEVMKKILKQYGLSYDVPKFDKKEVFDAITLDKKTTLDDINVILLKKIGEAHIVKLKLEEFKNYLDF